MNKVILLLVLLTPIISTASKNEIVATVVFENFTGKDFTSGKFFVTELNIIIDVNTEESFKITLPKKGKYQFGFYTEDFESHTYYPGRITSDKDIITIRLENKNGSFLSNTSDSDIKSKDSNLSTFRRNANMFPEGMNFIFNGINNSPIDFSDFKLKYGIGIVTKNCVADPLTFKKSLDHNRNIVNYLNEKFGDEWIKDLPAKPFGVD